jgi:hypothetical protein
MAMWHPSGRGIRCPVCHYPTLGERASYEICLICDWEDDGQDDADADVVRGGPNGDYSLTEARANFAAYLTMYRPEDKDRRQHADYLALKRQLITAYDAGASSEEIEHLERRLLICPRWKPDLP